MKTLTIFALPFLVLWKGVDAFAIACMPASTSPSKGYYPPGTTSTPHKSEKPEGGNRMDKREKSWEKEYLRLRRQFESVLARREIE